MAVILYDDTLQTAFNSGSANEQQWQFALRIITSAKASPNTSWTTRGSSTFGGSDGTAFSTTPDGVDRWTGRTAAQVGGIGGIIWHVIENADSGIQISLEVRNEVGNRGLRIAVAPVKFETGGAWRNAGSVTANVRPEDLTSGDTLLREVSSVTINDWQIITTAADDRCFKIRQDGKGFWAVTVRPSGTGSSAIYGIFPVTRPVTGETNPYIAFYVSTGTPLVGAFFDDTNPNATPPSNTRCTGRTSAGQLNYSPAGPAAARKLQEVDPFLGLRRGMPLALYTEVAPSHWRTNIPDFYQSRTGSDGATVGDTALWQEATDLTVYMKLNGAFLPWTGASAPNTFALINVGLDNSVSEPDPTPPLVQNIAPIDGAQQPVGAIEFDVIDDDPGLHKVYVWVTIAGDVEPRLVFDGVDFQGEFEPDSTVTPITDGFTFSLLYNGDWPGVVEDVTVVAYDTDGASVQESFGYIPVPPPPLLLQLVRSLDARTIEIVFSKPVIQAEAENPANYVTDPVLTIFSAVKQSDHHYRLFTSQQVIDQVYDVTTSNITDIDA